MRCSNRLYLIAKPVSIRYRVKEHTAENKWPTATSRAAFGQRWLARLKAGFISRGASGVAAEHWQHAEALVAIDD